jgi:hypothetical protein
MSNERETNFISGGNRTTEEHIDTIISRRQFMQGVMLASATAASLATSPAPAAGLSSGTATTVLTPVQNRVLALVLNRIIPAHGIVPGAGDLGVAGFIDQALEAAPHLRARIVGLLASLPDEQTLRQLPDAELDALLQRLESDQRHSFDLLLQATYTGYYSHAQVQNALGWVDPVDSGYGMVPFDDGSLESVRLRGLKLTSATPVRSGAT